MSKCAPEILYTPLPTSVVTGCGFGRGCVMLGSSWVWGFAPVVGVPSIRLVRVMVNVDAPSMQSTLYLTSYLQSSSAASDPLCGSGSISGLASVSIAAASLADFAHVVAS